MGALRSRPLRIELLLLATKTDLFPDALVVNLRSAASAAFSLERSGGSLRTGFAFGFDFAGIVDAGIASAK